jgi:hypothetical protein
MDIVKVQSPLAVLALCVVALVFGAFGWFVWANGWTHASWPWPLGLMIVLAVVLVTIAEVTRSIKKANAPAAISERVLFPAKTLPALNWLGLVSDYPVGHSRVDSFVTNMLSESLDFGHVLDLARTSETVFLNQNIPVDPGDAFVFVAGHSSRYAEYFSAFHNRGVISSQMNRMAHPSHINIGHSFLKATGAVSRFNVAGLLGAGTHWRSASRRFSLNRFESAVAKAQSGHIGALEKDEGPLRKLVTANAELLTDLGTEIRI